MFDLVFFVTNSYIFILKTYNENINDFQSIIKNKHLIGGVLLYGVATVAYIFALRGGELSILYPLVSLTYVFTIIFSQRVLGEKMNKYKWIGMILILIGVSLIGIGR